jgi:hypothetical protein
MFYLIKHKATLKNIFLKWLEKYWFIILVCIAFVSITFAIVMYRLQFPGKLIGDHEKWGQFGDYLGGVLNPFFGFFGFICLLYTIKLQKQELKQTTKELAKSAKALELQNKSLAQQNFENTFFQLLRRHGELVSEVSTNNHIGRHAFHALYEKLKS